MNKLMYIRSKLYLDIDPMENNIDFFSCQNKFECRIQDIRIAKLRKNAGIKSKHLNKYLSSCFKMPLTCLIWS